MRGGNISNETAPAVGLRFEGIIKTGEGKLNVGARGYLQTLMGNLDVNVYLITSEDPRKAMAFCVKWAVPYHKVIAVDSDLEIPDVVRANDMLSYYDTDKRIIQNVNTRGHGKIDARLWILEET